MIIYNSFINSNFNYCPIVWHFCGKKNGDKIEKIQERALRIIYRNYDSLYPELLRDAGSYTMLDKRLRSMLLHVFKSLKGMNAKCLNDMYSAKQWNYSMRRCVKLVQPQRKQPQLVSKQSHIWGPNCGMTMLYYVMSFGMKIFSPLNALLMTQI